MSNTKPASAEQTATAVRDEEALTRQMAARRRLEQHQEERRLRQMLREVFVDDEELW